MADPRYADPDYVHYLRNLDPGLYQYQSQSQSESEEEEEEEEEPARSLQNGPSIGEELEARVEEDGQHKRRRIEGGGEACSSNGSQENEWNRSEIYGLFCPICMEACTNDGDHHICCLPCGHIYGLSCIKRWLQQRRNSGKCPQCNRPCTLKGVRKLFASVDEESQKKIRSLEAKCASLEKKDAYWCKKEAEWHLKLSQLTKRTTYLEDLLGDIQNRASGLVNVGGHFQGRQGSSCSFILQNEFQVDGARLVDVDASGQILLIVRRLYGRGATSVLTKVSLIPPHEKQDIVLPSYIKSIKDLHISPSDGSLALLASLGQKLSVLSLESNHIIHSYDLPAPAWSCSWDLNSSQYMYAGLQNGSLLVFDMRQTVGPVNSLRGLTGNPVHTVHSLLHSSTLASGVRSILSASSIGLCQWNFGGAEEGPFLVPESANQGVCISLAYSPSSDDIVASYRPKVGMLNEMTVSQPSLMPSQVIGQGIQGSHFHYKEVETNCFQKLGSAFANVNDSQLPQRSAILDTGNQNQLFAFGDEVTSELILQELPSFTVRQRLKTQKRPIRDVKYTHTISQGLLSCLSADTLQLFSTKLS